MKHLDYAALYAQHNVNMGGNTMTVAEKVEMLAELTKEIGLQLSQVCENLNAYIKTYPELKKLLVVTIDFALEEDALVTYQMGNINNLKHRLEAMLKEVNKDE